MHASTIRSENYAKVCKRKKIKKAFQAATKMITSRQVKIEVSRAGPADYDGLKVPLIMLSGTIRSLKLVSEPS